MIAPPSNNDKNQPQHLNIYTNSSVCMTTFTLSIPDTLKHKIDRHPEINWPEYLKQRLMIRLRELQKFEQLRSQGKV